MKKVVLRDIVFAAAVVALMLCAGFASAAPADLWWDDGWPYRVRLTVSGSGVVRAPINFTAEFTSLGVPGSLLDVRSLRVVPFPRGRTSLSGSRCMSPATRRPVSTPET